MNESRCSSCDRLIRWGRTEAGRLMPLDREPNPNGNVWLHAGRFDPRGAQIIAHVGRDSTPPLDLDPEAIGPYLPHFASCPHADRHKRSRR